MSKASGCPSAFMPMTSTATSNVAGGVEGGLKCSGTEAHEILAGAGRGRRRQRGMRSPPKTPSSGTDRVMGSADGREGRPPDPAMEGRDTAEYRAMKLGRTHEFRSSRPLDILDTADILAADGRDDG